MQFKFDANQEYQIRAVEAVADLFDGQTAAALDALVFEIELALDCRFVGSGKIDQLIAAQDVQIGACAIKEQLLNGTFQLRLLHAGRKL